MGAFADYDAYQIAIKRLNASDFQMSGNFTRTSRLVALWRYFVPVPAVPTTSVALDNTSDVALPSLPPVNTGRLTILGARASSTVGARVCLIVVDILNHSGGLDGTITTEQTTNLPTATLTRYTSGEGVMAGLVLTGTVGNAATTVTVKYTNQSGTSGRISTETVIGGTNFRESGILIPIPLMAGDTGVRSVESVTLAGSTAGAGAFGVVLFKPLSMISLTNSEGAHVTDAITTGGFVGALAQAEPGACLSLLGVGSIASSAAGSILIAEV